MKLNEILFLDATGKEVVDLQTRLAALGFDLKGDEPGRFGKHTRGAVKEFQRARGLTVTGSVDSDTWEELVDAGFQLGDRSLYLKNPYFRGDDVRELQMSLRSLGFYDGEETSIYDEKTDRAVREFQRNMQIFDDGIVGSQTISQINALKKAIEFGSSMPYSDRRYIECKDGKGTNNRMLCIAASMRQEIDNGGIGVFGLTEAEVNGRLSVLCKKELALLDIDSVLIGTEGKADDLSLANMINESNVDTLIYLKLGNSSDINLEGCTCYFFKGRNSFSQNGKLLAELVKDEIVKKCGQKEIDVSGANHNILRYTKMTAVEVIPAYLSNPSEEKKLNSETFLIKVAHSIASGVANFYEKVSL
jgi:N-acetylmuramoyl-L-alanine amidase